MGEQCSTPYRNVLINTDHVSEKLTDTRTDPPPNARSDDGPSRVDVATPGVSRHRPKSQFSRLESRSCRHEAALAHVFPV
jgi:hypothetical protein